MMHARPMWKDGLHAQWYALLTSSRTLQRGCIADGKPGSFLKGYTAIWPKEVRAGQQQEGTPLELTSEQEPGWRLCA